MPATGGPNGLKRESTLALEFLSRLTRGKSQEDGTGADDGATRRDPRKAAAFFKHAETTADSRSYDYSIDCYINGLRHEPDTLQRHEELREVAKKRKVAGGKAPGIGAKLKSAGREPIGRMLHAERLWSLDPLNPVSAVKVMELAIAADAAHDDLHLGEVAYWVGEIALEMISAGRKPSKDLLMQVCDLYTQIPAFDKAVEACRAALALDSENAALLHRLKELETERTLQEGRYGSGEKGDFRRNIRDAEHQQALEEEDAISKSASVIASTIQRRRAEYDEDPTDIERLNKLVIALLRAESESSENEAIGLLEGAWSRTDQYRYKMQIGDVRMRQARRELRAARQACEAKPDDAGAREALAALTERIARAELEEFLERSQNYPTDMRIRFELGRRHFALQQYDEAIAEFQKSIGDPKHKPASCEFLGRCYAMRGWIDLAIEVLGDGIEAHDLHDDRLGMALRYLRMDALEKAATQSRSADQAAEAQKMASQILQTNINYRDIQDRLTRIRQLVADIRDAT